MLRVGRLTLTNPSTGETVTHTAGVFNAANTWGLVSEGAVMVGKRGIAIIFH